MMACVNAVDDVVKVVCASDWDGDYTAAAEAMKNFTLPVGEVRRPPACLLPPAPTWCAAIRPHVAPWRGYICDLPPHRVDIACGITTPA